jgi:gamma-glutamyl-gamma-aminobutyrate hydrolase PuuD
VTTYYANAAWAAWERPSAVVPAAYFELVAAAGARPLLLPPCRRGPAGIPHDPGAGADDVVGALDGLVLVGGGDLDPATYGQVAHPATGGVDPERDGSELALLAAALGRDLPTLAICRGLQILNVARGGTLLQHVPDVVGHPGHRPAPGQFADVDVVTAPGSTVAAVLGEKLTVACSHHQAVDRLGEGLVATAHSLDAEPVVEAVELPGHRFVVGVQWHPEESGDGRLFDALVAASR